MAVSCLSAVGRLRCCATRLHLVLRTPTQQEGYASTRSNPQCHFQLHPRSITLPHPAAPTSLRLSFQWETDSLTRSIVPCATARAFFDPASRISNTCFGFFSCFSLRSRTGAIHLIKFSAIAALHSMHPIPAVVHPCRTHSSRPGSSAENSLCQSYTGHTSGFPGSVLLFRAGSVTITFVFLRISSSGSLSVIAFP